MTLPAEGVKERRWAGLAVNFPDVGKISGFR
jgi:hypothetical protein